MKLPVGVPCDPKWSTYEDPCEGFCLTYSCQTFKSTLNPAETTFAATKFLLLILMNVAVCVGAFIMYWRRRRRIAKRDELISESEKAEATPNTALNQGVATGSAPHQDGGTRAGFTRSASAASLEPEP
jgi:hypothetical protein